MHTAEPFGSAAKHDAGKSSVRVELDDALSRELENWRRRQTTIPSKAEGVRRLLSRALANDNVAA
jgi:hypothetical protein